MPNMKNAKKAVKTSVKKKVENNNFKASMKTAIKNVEKAIASKDKAAAGEALTVAIKRIDKAASAGVITANYVARTKSRLTLKVNNME
ncbi:MAG: 30S ribosomal protein S20 [Tenericutes bacterium]|nr:30S ribosomal protein S20 [Mycoplasmatota bacterium]